MFGDEVLSLKSEPVQFPIADKNRVFIDKMMNFFEQNNWAGLAAPQISKSLQIFVFQVSPGRCENGERPIPVTLVINPKIIWSSLETNITLENCLSFPAVTGEVPRHNEIEYQYNDLSGNYIQQKAKGFHARVFQHEYDHLQGILFPQRMTADNRFFKLESGEEIPQRLVQTELFRKGVLQ